MTVAQVIVDVQAKQTDRPFDYRIPVHLQEVIKQGMRVIVPFGPRKVQGFVIAYCCGFTVCQAEKYN